MRRAAAAGLTGALVLLAGCGGSEPDLTAAPTGPVVLPPTPARVTGPAGQPTPANRKTPRSAARPKQSRPTATSPRRRYLQRLTTLAARLGPALDEAASSGDSAAIAVIDEEVMRTTDAWSASGGEPSPAAAALAMAIATARSNVETPLLLGESRRQVRGARADLAAELASG